MILAEPVGSCTDLVATVVQPLKDLYAGRFQVAPYSVLFKPSHGLRILRNEAAGFSPKAAYIFRKQLEEADAIVINRADELSAGEVPELKTLLAEQFPGTPVLVVSAKTGTGFDAYTALLDQDGAFGRKMLDIDYDIYAEGEAELGWLNASAHLTFAERRSTSTRCLIAGGGRLANRARRARRRGGAPEGDRPGRRRGVRGREPGEQRDRGRAVAAVERDARRGGPDRQRPRRDRPGRSWSARSTAWSARCAASAASPSTFRQSQSLRPGRPTPTHRYATAAG